MPWRRYAFVSLTGSFLALSWVISPPGELAQSGEDVDTRGEVQFLLLASKRVLNLQHRAGRGRCNLAQVS